MIDGSEREREVAFADAVAALRRRERTAAETAAWLRGRGVSEAVAEETVVELIAASELDDERFAHAFAADKRELSGWGPERIAAALVERGLDVALAESAGSEDHLDQIERAVGLLRRRFDSIGAHEERARALGFLLRRGFGYELAHDAIRRADRGGGPA